MANYTKLPTFVVPSGGSFTRLPSSGVSSYYYQGRNPVLSYHCDQPSGTITNYGSSGDALTASGSITYSQPSRYTTGFASSYSFGCGNGAGHVAKSASVTGFNAGTDNFTVAFGCKWNGTWPADTQRGGFKIAGATENLWLRFNTDKTCTIQLTDAGGHARAQTYTAASIFNNLTVMDEIIIVCDFAQTAMAVYFRGALLSVDSSSGDALTAFGAMNFNSSILLGSWSGTGNRWYGDVGQLWVCRGTGFWDNAAQSNVWSPQKAGQVWYKFDEASGSLVDAGTAAQNINLVYALDYQQAAPNGLTYSIGNERIVPGQTYEGYFSKDGPNTSITMAGNYCVWVAVVSLPSTHTLAKYGFHNGLFNFYSVGGGTSADMHGYIDTLGQFVFSITTDDGTGYQGQVSKGQCYDLIKDGSFHTLECYYDRTKVAGRFYVDGVERQVVNIQDAHLSVTSGKAFAHTGRRCQLNVDGTYTAYLGGKCAEFWFKSGSSDVTYYRNWPKYYVTPGTTYNRQASESALVHYKFTEPSGYLFDYGTAKQKLTVQGSATYLASAQTLLDYGVSFTGAGEFYDASNTVNISLSTSDFVLVVWVKVGALTSPAESYVWRFYNTGNNTYFNGWFDVSTKKFNVRLLDSGGTHVYRGEIAKADFYDLAQSSVVEAAFLMDRSETNMTFKLNNVSKTVTAAQGALSNLVSDSLTLNGRVIAGFSAGGTDWRFTGQISEWWLATGLTYTTNF